MATRTDQKIIDCLLANEIGFITSIPCKQLAGLIELADDEPGIMHVPSNREDEGLGLCAGAYMGGTNSCILMQNTALGVIVNSLVTLIQFYHVPLPMIISYRGEVGEKVACQVEMAIHTRPLLEQLNIPTYSLDHSDEAGKVEGIVRHSFMSSKPVAILLDAGFWGSAQ